MPVDTNKPAELLLFDFLTDARTAAVEGDAFFGDDFQIQDTVYPEIKKARGLRISDATSDMQPGTSQEYNASGQMVAFARVGGKNQKDRADAMTKVYELQRAVTDLIFGDASLGSRVCDITIGHMARGYDVLDGNPYAVAMIPWTINVAAVSGGV